MRKPNISPENKKGKKTLLYCVFENRYAKSGGLGTVASWLPRYLQNSECTVVVFSPFHAFTQGFSDAAAKLKIQKTDFSFFVDFFKKSVRVDVYKGYEDSVTEYFFKADGFFEAKNTIHDPYIYNAEDQTVNNELLFRDSIFFCKLVVQAMKALCLPHDSVFHLQDWQTALIACSIKEFNLKSKAFLTLHNTFDSYIKNEIFFKECLKEIPGIPIGENPGMKRSALSFALDYVQPEITTVSKNFAGEMLKDKIQKEYFIPHLISGFKGHTITGINNGKFIDFPQEIKAMLLLESDPVILHKLQLFKKEKRKRLLRILEEYQPNERFGELYYKDKSISHLPESIPLFCMTGRLDFNQKGFDILLKVIERIYENDSAKFILAPLPVTPKNLEFFKEIAAVAKGSVTVFPIRMEKGYHELLAGSSYGVMPSLYEPFGAAVEYMVNATVPIARKTGGLINQIQSSNGYLYLEKGYSKITKTDMVRYFIENSYLSDLSIKNRFIENSWANKMADALTGVIQSAIKDFGTARYYRKILCGLKKACHFEWEKSAEEYRAILLK